MNSLRQLKTHKTKYECKNDCQIHNTYGHIHTPFSHRLLLPLLNPHLPPKNPQLKPHLLQLQPQLTNPLPHPLTNPLLHTNLPPYITILTDLPLSSHQTALSALTLSRLLPKLPQPKRKEKEEESPKPHLPNK